MSIKIIDYPHPVAESFYLESLQMMTQRLMKMDSVKTIYQVGGISSPGISDLDMVVVFNQGAVVDTNLLAGLNKEERYLFIHNLYGISADNFPDAERFAFYHQYKLLAGKEVRSNAGLPEPDVQTLKIQVALEYMVKMHITLFLQHKYGVIRMRDLLLHVKALKYDLDFLGVTSGAVNMHVEQVLEWRKNWFTETPSEKEVISWWNDFYRDYNQLVSEKLGSLPFYLPPRPAYRVAKNILLLPSTGKITSFQKGVILPKLFSSIGKKYFRLQNRLNRFRFEIPVQSAHIPTVVEKKFHFEKNIVEYNKKYLPHFLPLTSSLHVL